jgi:hypothetical protein
MGSGYGEKQDAGRVSDHSGFGAQMMRARWTLVATLHLATLMAQPPHRAFLLKTGRWASHPDSATLKVGGGTVIVLKGDGSAIRYSGEVWEYGPSKQYELQGHSGFVADGGHWENKPGGGLRVMFDKTAAEKTVPVPSDGREPLRLGPCSTSRTLASATEIVCGTVKLRRIELKAIPKAVEAALSRVTGEK